MQQLSRYWTHQVTWTLDPEQETNKVKQGHPMTAPTHSLPWVSFQAARLLGRKGEPGSVQNPKARQQSWAPTEAKGPALSEKRQKRRSCPDSRLHSVSAALPWQWRLAYVCEETTWAWGKNHPERLGWKIIRAPAEEFLLSAARGGKLHRAFRKNVPQKWDKIGADQCSDPSPQSSRIFAGMKNNI